MLYFSQMANQHFHEDVFFMDFKSQKSLQIHILHILIYMLGTISYRRTGIFRKGVFFGIFEKNPIIMIFRNVSDKRSKHWFHQLNNRCKSKYHNALRLDVPI